MSEQHQEEALGLALANHTLTVALARTLALKGILTQDELDGAVNDSLTVLETAVPDRDAVRTARLILEQMLIANPFPARAKTLTAAG